MNNFQDEVVYLVNSFLEGKTGAIEISRKIIRLSYDLGIQDSDEISVFKALESQTDHFPIGALRNNYSDERLKEIDEETKDYEDYYKESVTDVCLKLIDKYSTES